MKHAHIWQENHQGTFTYDVRCFWVFLTYQPTLIRYFTTEAYFVKLDAAWPTYLPKNLKSYVNASSSNIVVQWIHTIEWCNKFKEFVIVFSSDFFPFSFKVETTIKEPTDNWKMLSLAIRTLEIYRNWWTFCPILTCQVPSIYYVITFTEF